MFESPPRSSALSLLLLASAWACSPAQGDAESDKFSDTSEPLHVTLIVEGIGSTRGDFKTGESNTTIRAEETAKRLPCTARPLELFVVSDEEGELYFTDGAQMILSSDGSIETPGGMNFHGFPINEDGGFASQPTALSISTSPLAPRATSEVSLVANLDPEEPVPYLAWNPQDPSAGSNFSGTISVYDSLGALHSLELYFRKSGTSNFEFHVLANGDEIVPRVPGLNTDLGEGSVSFLPHGALDLVVDNQISVSFDRASPNQLIEFNFGSTVSNGGTGLDGLTQFSAPSSASAQSQDGYSSAEFLSFSVDAEGVVRAMYTSGEEAMLHRLAVARFTDSRDLFPLEDGLFAYVGDKQPEFSFLLPSTLSPGQVSSDLEACDTPR